jgi:hypothetical protein
MVQFHGFSFYDSVVRNQQNENEPLEHFELRYLLQEMKAIVLPMSPNQRKIWVAESRLAQEIDTILVQHPECSRSFEL